MKKKKLNQYALKEEVPTATFPTDGCDPINITALQLLTISVLVLW